MSGLIVMTKVCRLAEIGRIPSVWIEWIRCIGYLWRVECLNRSIVENFGEFLFERMLVE